VERKVMGVFLSKTLTGLATLSGFWCAARPVSVDRPDRVGCVGRLATLQGVGGKEGVNV